jgi:RluA family pseudouridine synthase
MKWVVGAGDGGTVGEVLSLARADERAVDEGRVFVGSRRVRRADEKVHAGDVVNVAAPDAGRAAGVTILVRTDDLVAADKPAGIPTIPDHGGSAHALLASVARGLDVDPARLHPTSRLDRDVSGVVVFALTIAGRERLAAARAAGAYERRYVAIASKAPSPDRGTWDAPIGRARDPRLRAANGRDPVPARTRYALVACAPGGAALLAVAPVTGRTHQIRVHAAHAGVPLVGDRSYGGAVRVTLPSGRVLEPGRVALHAARVVVPAPDGAPLVIVSPLPPELHELWSALGGDRAAWEGSSSCELS